MKRVTVADAPAVLNTNDKAFWAIGWNDCAEVAEAAVKQAREDALEEARQACVTTFDLRDSDFARMFSAKCADSIEYLKGKP